MSPGIGLCPRRRPAYKRRPENLDYQGSLKKVQGLYDRGHWEEGDFEHLGRRIQQLRDGTIMLPKSVDAVDESTVNKLRKKHTKSLLTAAETTQCRSVLGQLQHEATNSMPLLNAGSSSLQGEAPRGNGNTFPKINKFVRKTWHDGALAQVFRLLRDICLVGFSDAS